MPLSALIFDVDGTLAETEELHREAFNHAFEAFDLPMRWDQAQYGELLKVTGGKERILHDVAARHPERLEAVRAMLLDLHRAKTERYGALVDAGGLSLRPGVARIIAEAKLLGLRLGIATTTTRSNVTALLKAAFPLSGAQLFDAVAAGDEVAHKKPAPDIFLLALERLGVPADQCLAFEDSNNGVAAALAAGLPVIAVPSLYLQSHCCEGAASVVSDLGEPGAPHRHIAGRRWPGGFVSLAAWTAAEPPAALAG